MQVAGKPRILGSNEYEVVMFEPAIAPHEASIPPSTNASDTNSPSTHVDNRVRWECVFCRPGQDGAPSLAKLAAGSKVSKARKRGTPMSDFIVDDDQADLHATHRHSCDNRLVIYFTLVNCHQTPCQARN